MGADPGASCFAPSAEAVSLSRNLLWAAASSAKTREEASRAIWLCDRLATLVDNQPHCVKNGKLLIFSLVAATLGGLDSLGGALVGGLLIGISQTMIAGYVGFIGTELSLPGALLVMVVVLLFRPTGLFGTKRIERV